MRSLLRRPSTRSVSSEPGVVHLEMDVSEFGNSLHQTTRRELAEVAAGIIWDTADRHA
jgi:hypothetical protein